MSIFLDILIAELRDAIDMHTARLHDGAIDADTWQQLVARDLIEHHVAAYLAEKPGDQVLRSADKRILQQVLGAQMDWLNPFADLMDGAEWQAAWDGRARMYAGAIRHSFERGKTFGIPLPYYPCEGTRCLSNCGCNWDVTTIDADAGDYDALWKRGKNDSCETCVAREENNPHEIRGGVLL